MKMGFIFWACERNIITSFGWPKCQKFIFLAPQPSLEVTGLCGFMLKDALVGESTVGGRDMGANGTSKKTITMATQNDQEGIQRFSRVRDVVGIRTLLAFHLFL